jgi:hypothetical protein
VKEVLSYINTKIALILEHKSAYEYAKYMHRHVQ